MKRTLPFYLSVLAAMNCTVAGPVHREKLLIAHRGASAYAPEHTRSAYELAIGQGADYIEPDLHLTRDGVFICLHDVTLERTTDVAMKFPDRKSTRTIRGREVRGWFAPDFTLAEIRSLDAGSWLHPRFSDARIPTFEEVVAIARGRVGVIPELKDPDLYRDLGLAMADRFHEEAQRLGLGDGPGQVPTWIQSFSPEALQRLRDLGSTLPRVFLFGGSEASRWTGQEALADISGFAQGIGPAKSILLEVPELSARARAQGLKIFPYTFRAAQVPERFADVAAEMGYFLYELGVDGLFTDNPDLFPRR